MKKRRPALYQEHDRLGRNYEEILQQWRIITKDKGVDIVVLDMPCLIRAGEKTLWEHFSRILCFKCCPFVAENERTNIRQRQTEGIAAAKARGVRFGPFKGGKHNKNYIFDHHSRLEM